MKTVTIRLSDSEHEVLNAHSLKMSAAVGTLVRMAAIKLSEKLGAKPRTEGTTTISVQLWPADKAALIAYQAAAEHTTLTNAAQAALRIGLIKRGCLTMSKGSEPDSLGGV